MRLFDSHCHLQDKRIAPRLLSALAHARDAGVERMLCCGNSAQDWDAVARLAQEHAGVIPAFGLHPWYAQGRSTDWIDSLREFLGRHPGAAIGEIGLDHALDRSTFAAQEEVLAAQFRLARELDRPVSVHCRRAWDRIIAIARHTGLPGRGGALHAYSGSPELVMELEALGFSVSFAGSLTYDRNKRGVRSCAAVSAERLLIETDAPDLTPVGAPGNPRRDRRTISGETRDRAGINEPANLPLVVQAAARARGVGEEEVAELTWRNAAEVFLGD
jgi:TatD DNase family protein